MFKRSQGILSSKVLFYGTKVKIFVDSKDFLFYPANFHNNNKEEKGTTDRLTYTVFNEAYTLKAWHKNVLAAENHNF